jgi:hypothetical protein
VRYVLRTFLGMALFAFCWVAFAYAIFQLLQVGTCASGGPYVSARECPDGIERLMLVIPCALFLMFGAAFVYGGRGAPPDTGRKPANGGIIVWFWTGLFWSLAIGCFLGVWGPDANPGPGGKEGGLIVGFMGLLFGIGGLATLSLGRRVRDPQKRSALIGKVVQTATRFTPASGGSVERLERLDGLRRQGALTDAEFETLKAKLIEDA